MTLYDKIIEIYPELATHNFADMNSIVLMNDGDDDYIAKWDHPTLTRPTYEQLA
jgi:hypothetical protein